MNNDPVVKDRHRIDVTASVEWNVDPGKLLASTGRNVNAGSALQGLIPSMKPEKCLMNIVYLFYVGEPINIIQLLTLYNGEGLVPCPPALQTHINKKDETLSDFYPNMTYWDIPQGENVGLYTQSYSRTEGEDEVDINRLSGVLSSVYWYAGVKPVIDLYS